MQSRPGLGCPPLPPGARQIPSGRGFLFLLQILRRVQHLSRRKKEVGASPGGTRRAGSEGERGRGKAHKPGLKSGSQAAITALDKTAIGGGGRSRSEGGPVTIYFDRPPPQKMVKVGGLGGGLLRVACSGFYVHLKSVFPLIRF